MSLHIHEGSILDCQVEAIVNPANSFLRHGGGLARVIADAAAPRGWEGAQEWWTEQIAHPSIATGNVAVTNAGKLPFECIIHAVGPIWDGGHFLEKDLLQLTYESILGAAEELSLTSIAVPAISCGLFRFPVEEAAPIAAQVLSWHEDYGIERVEIALIEPLHIEAYKEAINEL